MEVHITNQITDKWRNISKGCDKFYEFASSVLIPQNRKDIYSNVKFYEVFQCLKVERIWKGTIKI